MAVEWKKVAYAEDVIIKTLLSTKGDIIYASAANTPARLGVGTDGHVLTVNTDVPNWEAPSGGGGGGIVLQAQRTLMTGIETLTGSVWNASSLSVAITPTDTDNIILLRGIINCSGASAGIRLGMRVYVDIGGGGYNPLTLPDAGGSRDLAHGGGHESAVNSIQNIPICDFYQVVGAGVHTFKVYLSPDGSAGSTAYVNRSSADTNASSVFRTVSYIEAIEISV